jgi:hypothetical protein
MVRECILVKLSLGPLDSGVAVEIICSILFRSVARGPWISHPTHEI